MQKSRLHKISSYVLIYAYINLLALTVFHIHTLNYNSNSTLTCYSSNPVKIVDPFSDDESNRGITQFSGTSYIDEKVFSTSASYSFNNNDYNAYLISSKPLQVIYSANSLRAPPLAS
jgi:hypothetical protein